MAQSNTPQAILYEYAVRLGDGGSAVRPRKVREPWFAGDCRAHVFRLRLYGWDDEAIAPETGDVLVTATAVRSDGVTVTARGTAEDGVLTVELPAAAYAVEGPVNVFVHCTAGERIQTLLWVCAEVCPTSTGTVAETGDVTDLAALLAQIDRMEKATAETKTASAAAEKAAGQVWSMTADARDGSSLSVSKSLNEEGGIHLGFTIPQPRDAVQISLAAGNYAFEIDSLGDLILVAPDNIATPVFQLENGCLYCVVEE